MELTTAQKATLKAYIQNDPVLSLATHDGSGSTYIADKLNVITNFVVWQTQASVLDIFDAINWANLTPSDIPDGTNAWLCRSLACQGKQFNLQTILSSRTTINASKANIRAGLQDALTSIPSGIGGANKNAGWTNVNLIMQRNASLIEQILATGTGTTANPATLVFEGLIYYTDINNVMGWA